MPQPNVLLICVDHWPGLLMGAAGHERILTPTLDALCESGVRFSEAYSAAPTCIPARRALMTGTTPRTHGDRTFREREPMPANLPTLPQVFRDNGYQAYAVGKLHVYPQRDRIGFDEVILHEEGRHHLGGGRDDYELFLADQGYPGQELTHAMGNNAYHVRPWHLPEHCHATNWTTKQMCRTIQRRDPTRPAFWYCSYAAPHQPVTPLRDYLEIYRELGVDEPFVGSWADDLPHALRRHRDLFRQRAQGAERLTRMAFYAQCTYIDHQLRLLIGTLNEEGLLDNTIILFTGDHGDMLGHHGLWCKPPMLEYSAKIPMILSGTADDGRVGHHRTDGRLIELRDVMPTLLDLCGLPIPETVEGHSLVSETRRDHLYGEHHEDDRAMRMIRRGDYKLIYYPVGHRFQLFNLAEDPRELTDLSADPAHAAVREELAQLLIDHLYGSDLEWVKDGALIGLPDIPYAPAPNRSLSAQRGWR